MSYTTVERSVAEGSPIELYHFAQGTRRWRYTSSQAAVEYLSETYSPLSLTRGAIEQANEIHRNGLEITLPRDCPLGTLFLAAPPEGIVSVTIYRRHLPDPEFITYWKGRVSAARFSGSVLQLKCEPIATSMKRVGLRARYQLLYRHVLYSASCGALRERFRVDGLVAGVSGTQVTVVAAAGQANGYFTAGMLSSPVGLRMITAHNGSSLTLVAPLMGLAVGDAVSLFAGCDHSMGQCASRFDNLDQFGGFPFIPVKNPFTGDAIV
jgi:uncharacterized phage protein (TIGR02218 family)